MFDDMPKEMWRDYKTPKIGHESEERRYSGTAKQDTTTVKRTQEQAK